VEVTSESVEETPAPIKEVVLEPTLIEPVSSVITAAPKKTAKQAEALPEGRSEAASAEPTGERVEEVFC
jgi:hypothetical protein